MRNDKKSSFLFGSVIRFAVSCLVHFHIGLRSTLEASTEALLVRECCLDSKTRAQLYWKVYISMVACFQNLLSRTMDNNVNSRALYLHNDWSRETQ